MNYFGTNLNSAGHYFWKLDGEYMTSLGLSFPKGENGIPLSLYLQWPFNPEDMPRREKGEGVYKGQVKYYRENGYTICAIEGSCKDDRPGTKSVFFTDEPLKFWELAVKIMSIPAAKRIIEQMPFKVKWGLDEEYMKILLEQ